MYIHNKIAYTLFFVNIDILKTYYNTAQVQLDTLSATNTGDFV